MATQGVEFANVSFALPGGRQLLSDVSLRVAAGTTTALLGRSGSGKTTLLRMVNRLADPTSGHVLVEGKDVSTENVILLRRRVGYVIQETGLFPHITVRENVWLPLKVNSGLGGHTDEGEAAVQHALESVGLPYAEYRDRYPWQLSGGQRQRAGVARALVNNANVLLMDEPFGALDPLTRAEMQTMLRQLLRRVGKTTLIVTHDLDEALYLADRVVLLDAGKVVADLASGDVRTSEIGAIRAYVAATHRVTA